MKKFSQSFKKILYRTIPFVVALIIFCYLPLSAKKVSAASYTAIDYQDYIQDVSYDSDSKIVHTMFSWQLNYLQLTQNNQNLYYEYGTSNFVCDWSWLQLSPVTNVYDFFVTSLPLGNRMLKLDNFPKDTEFVFEYRIEEHRGHQVSVNLKIDFQWYDKDFNYIGFTTAYEESRMLSDSKVFDVSVPLQIHTPDNVKFLRIRVLLDCIADRKQDLVSFSIYPGNLYLDIPLSSIMVQEEQNQKIIDQLGDMVNGTPEQNQQVQNDVNKMENSADKLGDLTDDMSVTKPDLSGVDVSADSIVDIADQALLTAPLTKLWEDPTILGIVTTVFTLILVSWVFFGKKE